MKRPEMPVLRYARRDSGDRCQQNLFEKSVAREIRPATEEVTLSGRLHLALRNDEGWREVI